MPGPGVKITDLPTGNPVGPNDPFESVQGGASVKVTGLSSAIVPTGADDTALLQAAHDTQESNLGGVVTLAPGATYKVNGGLIWDKRLVGLRGNGAVLDFSGNVPVGVGTDLVTGDNQTFTNSTGSWSFTNANGFIAIQLGTVGGTPTPGDTLTVTATSASIVGSPINIPYTVQTGDTLFDIAAGLVAAINAESHMQAHGVTSVPSLNTPVLVIYITQSIVHPIVWSSSVSGGATSTLAMSLGSAPPTGMLLKNTTTAQGTAVLAITTVPDAYYSVSYEMHVDQLAQINLSAQIKNGSNSLGFCANQNLTWFIFRARSTTTYLQAKVSTSNTGDAGSIGQVRVRLAVPPSMWVIDRSNQFANVFAGGSGYVVGDTLVVQGGSPVSQATIVVGEVDGSGAVTFAQIADPGSYPLGGYPTNPVAVAGGTGTNASFNIGISTPQFGHEAYPMEDFIMIGSGRNLTYIVDSQTEFSLYSDPTASIAVYANSYNLSANRNSTSTRGTLKNVVIEKFVTAAMYVNQTYLYFPDDIGISNCNFGWVITAGGNSGENNVISRGYVTGCDLLLVSDQGTIKFDKTSFDFPRQASIRINSNNSTVIMNECHHEIAPPGIAVVGGTPTTGDVVSFTATSTILTGSPITVTYTVLVGDTTASIAAGVAAAIMANGTLTTAGVNATSNGSDIIIFTPTALPTIVWTFAVSGAATETITNNLPIPIAFNQNAKQARLVVTGGEQQVTGTFPKNSFAQWVSTTNQNQFAIFNNVNFNNIIGCMYLVSGPANVSVPVPSRLDAFPSVPQLLSDQPGRQAYLDCYGQGAFETPPVATSTNPNGLIFVGASLDDGTPQGNNGGGFNTKYTQRNIASNRASLVLVNTVAHSGSQSLSITKTTVNTTDPTDIYLLAPCRPGYQHWWNFWINVPAPGTPGGPANFIITVSQDFTQLAGTKTIFAQSGVSFATMTSVSAAGYPPYLSGISKNLGQVFTGNATGGVQVSNVNGTNGWQFFTIDTFNHGYQKAPDWASHCMLKIDLGGLDNATTWNAASGVSCYIDDVFCWRL